MAPTSTNEAGTPLPVRRTRSSIRATKVATTCGPCARWASWALAEGSVGVMGASGGLGSPPGSLCRALSPRVFVPQVIQITRSRTDPFLYFIVGFIGYRIWFGFRSVLVM
jgi:hypothetical protein